jgi:hypothetical protein
MPPPTAKSGQPPFISPQPLGPTTGDLILVSLKSGNLRNSQKTPSAKVLKQTGSFIIPGSWLATKLFLTAVLEISAIRLLAARRFTRCFPPRCARQRKIYTKLHLTPRLKLIPWMRIIVVSKPAFSSWKLSWDSRMQQAKWSLWSVSWKTRDLLSARRIWRLKQWSAKCSTPTLTNLNKKSIFLAANCSACVLCAIRFCRKTGPLRNCKKTVFREWVLSALSSIPHKPRINSSTST